MTDATDATGGRARSDGGAAETRRWPDGVAIVPMSPQDWPGVERLYVAGIATGHATFEEPPPTWEAFEAAKLPGQRLVALDGDGRATGRRPVSVVRCQGDGLQSFVNIGAR